MVRLRGLGECLFEIGASTLTPDSSTLFALLLYLARHAGDQVPRDRLLALFWPTADEESASHRLRQNVYRLRRLGAVVHTRADGVQLDAAHTESDQARIYITPELLEAGIDEQRLGVFLPGYAPRVSPRFDAWVDAERTVVGLELRDALLTRLMEARTRGRFAEVERLSRRCLMLDPLNEEATLALAEATALRGSKVEAVRMVDDYLAEIGPAAGELRIAPLVLRKRISERLGVLESPTGEPRFTGREREMEVLTISLRNARNGNTALCAIHGEAGVGKSRLLREFIRSSSLHAFRILAMESRAGDERLPLGAFVHLVPQLLRLPGALACTEHSLELLKQIHVYEHEQDDNRRSRPESPYSHARIRRSIFELIDGITTECSLLIHIDDAQHLDALSLAIFREIVTRYRGRPLLIVMTARDSVPSTIPWQDLRGDRVLTEVPVRPLTEEHAETLISHMLKLYDARLSADECRTCVQHGAGNPAMIRELVISLALGTLKAAEHPTLRTLLSQRITRLDPVSLRVLQVCAVLGTYSTLDALEVALEYPAFRLIHALEQLEGAGLIRGTASCHICRHELIREEALSLLSTTARRLLNRRAALALESILSASSEVSLLWDITQQWILAEDADRALQYGSALSQHLCSIGMSRDALELLDKLSILVVAPSQRRALLDARATAYMSGGDWGRVVEALEEQRTIPTPSTVEDSPHTSEELRLLDARWRHNPTRADLLDNVVRCALSTDASQSHRLGAVALGLSIADNAAAADCAEQLFRSVSSDTIANDADVRSLAHVGLIYHSSFGELSQAKLEGARLRKVIEDSGPRWMIAHSLRWLTIPHLRLGEFYEATSLASEAAALHERTSQMHGYIAACGLLSDIAIASGKLRLAKTWSERALQSGRDHDFATVALGSTVAVSQVALLAHDVATARRHFPYILGKLPSVTVRRSRTKCLAVLLHAAEIVPGSIDVESMRAELGTLLVQLSSHGDQDYSQAVYTRSLARVDQPAATTWWQRYLSTQRRERYPVPDSVIRCALALPPNRAKMAAAPPHRSRKT